MSPALAPLVELVDPMMASTELTARLSYTLESFGLGAEARAGAVVVLAMLSGATEQLAHAGQITVEAAGALDRICAETMASLVAGDVS